MKKIILCLLLLLCLAFLRLPQAELTLCFTGDIMLDRDVRSHMDRYGMSYPYEMVKDYLIDSDITFGNLECPLTDGGNPSKDNGILFKADTKNAPALKGAGFDILSLSNNHIFDYGEAGFRDTMEALNDNGIKYTVHGSEPTILKRQGIKVGFLAYCEFVSDITENRIKYDILNARRSCDFLIVSFHSGAEYNPYPTENQKKWARLSIDWGANLIICHHPHVLQGMEKYKGRYIFYSLGNFIFDRQIQDGTDESMILKIKIDKHGVKDMEIIPVIIRSCRPEIAMGMEKEQLLQKFQQLSNGITPP